MPHQLLRTVVAAGSAGLLLALSACSGSTPDSAPTSADAAPASKNPAGASSGTPIVLPEFPVPRVPDVGALTSAASAIETAIAAADPLPDGLTVTGARCDTAGHVINRAGVNIAPGQVTSGDNVKQVEPDGSGQITDGDSTYQVDADGSGQVTSNGAVLQVEADGSGQAVVGLNTYQVAADRSGQVTTNNETYQVEADGSGQWTWPDGTLTNDGAGAGTWTGPSGVVVVNGDGTGTLDGAAVSVPAMADLALLGRLPRLQTLTPLGQRCGTLIRIDAGVLFDFDKAEIRPKAQPVLAAIAKTLTGTGSVDVDGYTDAKGTDAYNLDLSDRRAAAVVSALKAAGARTPLRPHGYGEARPIAQNTVDGKDNPAGRQLNRRVELVIRSGS